MNRCTRVGFEPEACDRELEVEQVEIGSNVAEARDEVLHEALPTVRIQFLRRCGDDSREVVGGDRS